jgi:hypothetical protein
MERAGLKPEVADVTMKALNEIHLQGAEAEQMRHLLDALEDLDDTQHVYSSATCWTHERRHGAGAAAHAAMSACTAAMRAMSPPL